MKKSKSQSFLHENCKQSNPFESYKVTLKLKRSRAKSFDLFDLAPPPNLIGNKKRDDYILFFEKTPIQQFNSLLTPYLSYKQEDFAHFFTRHFLFFHLVQEVLLMQRPMTLAIIILVMNLLIYTIHILNTSLYLWIIALIFILVYAKRTLPLLIPILYETLFPPIDELPKEYLNCSKTIDEGAEIVYKIYYPIASILKAFLTLISDESTIGLFIVLNIYFILFLITYSFNLFKLSLILVNALLLAPGIYYNGKVRYLYRMFIKRWSYYWNNGRRTYRRFVFNRLNSFLIYYSKVIKPALDQFFS